MREPVWIAKAVVLAAQEEMLAEHGGASGLRDDGLLESAHGRPQNLFLYGKPSLFQLAAAYASGIIKNHPFVDGNKRAGFLAAYIFLARNGHELVASEVDATVATLAVASNDLTEDQFGDWLRKNSRRILR